MFTTTVDLGSYGIDSATYLVKSKICKEGQELCARSLGRPILSPATKGENGGQWINRLRDVGVLWAACKRSKHKRISRSWNHTYKIYNTYHRGRREDEISGIRTA